MTTRTRNARAAAALAVAASGLLLAGCSALGLQEPPPPEENTAVLTEACGVMVEELKATGMSLSDLVPSDLSQVDGQVLADAYDTASGALDRARDRVSDVRVGDAIDTVSGAVDELSPLIAAAASGDPQALIAAADPLARLAGAASSCAGRAL